MPPHPKLVPQETETALGSCRALHDLLTNNLVAEDFFVIPIKKKTYGDLLSAARNPVWK